MADKDEFEGWTPEQLKTYFLTGQRPDAAAPVAAAAQPASPMAEVVAARREAAANPPSTPVAEQVEPSAIKRGLAALGGALQQPFVEGAEKLRMAFPGEGAAGKAELARIAEERAQRRGYQRQLAETPAGQAGQFLGHAIPAAVVPPTIGAQMGLAGASGFLSGGPDRPKGLGGEMAQSAVSGGIDAATAGGVMKGIDLAGRGVNAARGAYSPQGQRAMDVDAAARRLGINDVSAGQLFPNTPGGQIATRLPTYPRDVEGQAAALERAIQTERQVPNATGPGTTAQAIPGGALREDLQNAVQTRMAQGREKYQAVDQFAQANNLGNVAPIYSLPQLTSLQKGAVRGEPAPLLAINMMAQYNPQSLSWLGDALAAGATPAQIKAAGIPMSTYHDMRVAAGRALSNLDRVNPASKTAEQWRAQKLLADLKTGLDNEAEQWAKQNAGNREAMDLYNSAKDFYRDVVAPTVMGNPLARKATSPSRGWNEMNPRPMYSAVINPQNAGLVDVLRPTMNQRGRDVLDVMQGLPDVGRMVASGAAPTASGKGELGALAKVAMGHPVMAAMEMLPGVGALSKTNPIKRLVAARSPLSGTTGRGLASAAQYQQDEASEAAMARLGIR